MSLTVQKALALPPLTLGTVVAGAGGLDREINSVTVQEIINEDLISVKFLTAGVFIVSSLYAIAEDTDTQVSLIRRLDDCQVSALALFNVGPVMPQIRSEAVLFKYRPKESRIENDRSCMVSRARSMASISTCSRSFSLIICFKAAARSLQSERCSSFFSSSH